MMTPMVFEDLPSFINQMNALKSRGRDEGYSAVDVSDSVLVHDRASDRVLVSYRFKWDPLMELACCTVERERVNRRLAPEPFEGLVHATGVQWTQTHPGHRVGIFSIGDEKEVSGHYGTLGELSPYYAWLGRPALRVLMKGGMRQSDGLLAALKILF